MVLELVVDVVLEPVVDVVLDEVENVDVTGTGVIVVPASVRTYVPV